VVGEAADGEERWVWYANAANIVLMDIRMPRLDGLAATRGITSDAACGGEGGHAHHFELDEYVFEAIRAGASGSVKDTERRNCCARSAPSSTATPCSRRRDPALIAEFAARSKAPAAATPWPNHERSGR